MGSSAARRDDRDVLVEDEQITVPGDDEVAGAGHSGTEHDVIVGVAAHGRLQCDGSAGSTLIATSRPSFVSVARYTSPIPPAPIAAVIR
jgi:hypothetical protein